MKNKQVKSLTSYLNERSKGFDETIQADRGRAALAALLDRPGNQDLKSRLVELYPNGFPHPATPWFPDDPTRKCHVPDCEKAPVTHYVYCHEHSTKRCKSMPKGEFVRTISPPCDSPPCDRCGRFGVRFRYAVQVDGVERDVCMDCGDEMAASPLYANKAPLHPTKTPFHTCEAAAVTPACEVDKATHESIVANYLQLCQVVRIAAMGNDENAKKAWPRLRDAVIFELPTTAYSTLHTEFTRYVKRSAKVEPDIKLGNLSAKQMKRIGAVLQTGADAPFPEKLPFQSCFFAYGGGVEVTYEEESVGTRTLYGHLVCRDGLVVAFWRVTDDAGGQRYMIERDATTGAKWQAPHTLAPWIINALVSYVNEHKTLIEAGKNGLGYQMLVKKTAKALSLKPPVPPPFYVVYMKDELMRERVRVQSSAIKRHIDWQHRWNVRGHDCIRFMRGPLPLDPDLEAELLKRRYKIFTVEQPDSETFMALAKRGVPPKGTDEWFAVLQYWRADFIKGDASKPLIESVRRSTKKWGT